jgi:hypothetical protein
MNNDKEPTTFLRKRPDPVTIPADAIKKPWVCASCGTIGDATKGGYVNIRGYLYCDGECSAAALSNNPCRGCGK